MLAQQGVLFVKLQLNTGVSAPALIAEYSIRYYVILVNNQSPTRLCRLY